MNSDEERAVSTCYFSCFNVTPRGADGVRRYFAKQQFIRDLGDVPMRYSWAVVPARMNCWKRPMLSITAEPAP